MKTLKSLLTVVLIVMIFTFCDKDSENTPIDFSKQKIVFQYEYVNHAWEYTHRGWLMDTSGNVYCYNKPEGWIFIEATGAISKADMENNLSKTDDICHEVIKSTLDTKMQLIDEAKQGTLSIPNEVMADAGVSVFKAFIFNESTQKYESVVIKQIGDNQILNNASAASDLFNWMVDINGEIWE